MSVMPVNISAPETQAMTKDRVVEVIVKHEESGGRCSNVFNIIMAALCGMVGCPLCCWFCCGCTGKCAPVAMIPRGIKDVVGKMPPDELRALNCENHVTAMALGCSPTALCSACMCCGACGRCGPYVTGKLVALANEHTH
jgi:hypothetical protein